MTSLLRVGIVNYLNSRPLAWSFLRDEVPPAIEAHFLPPAQVADQLAAGDLDVGLIPSIEVQRIPGLKVVPGLCVAATREVRSVLLLSRRPIARIRRLALDENSRTSAALVRILLCEVFGIEPEYRTFAPRLDEMLADADAALVIGDPALSVDRQGLQVLDLAAAWRRLTGRPFVFAVWAGREELDLAPWEQTFHQSLEQGRAQMDVLVHEAAVELKLDVGSVRDYLNRCLSFDLGMAERDGLNEFYRRAHSLGILESLRPIDFGRSCGPASDSVE